MKKMNKKLISILLAVIMIFGTTAVGLTAFAADGYVQFNDTYHRNIAENKLEAHTYGAYDASTGTATCTLCDYAHSCLENGHLDADENCVCDLCSEATHIDKNPQDHICDRCGANTHTWILYSHTDATCSSGDRYVYRCLTCGYAAEETVGDVTGIFNHDENGVPLPMYSFGDGGGTFQTIKIIDGYTLALGHHFDFSSQNVEITWSGLESDSANPYIQATGKFTCARCGFTVTMTVENLEETSSGKIELLPELLEPTCYSGITQYKATFKVPEGNDPSRYITYTDTKASNYGMYNDHVPAEPVEENRSEPTCTEDGSYDSVVYCQFHDVCKTEISREKKVIPALGHIEGEPVEENRVEPTCTEPGSYDSVIYCTRDDCGAEVSREKKVIPALGHIEGEPVEENRVEPTCGADGKYDLVVYCTRDDCGAELSRETITIPATGNHVYNNLGFCEVCGAHDCEGKGHSYIGGYEMDDNYHWKECAYCGAISSDGRVKDDEGNYIEADGIKLPHVDANEDGMCDVCTYSKGHKWQLVNTQSPSCASPGFNEYTCAFHPEETKRVDLPPLGHYWYDDHNEADRQYVTFSFSSNFESCTLTFKCRRPECGQTVSYTVYTDPSDNGAVLSNATTNKPISKGTDANCEAGSGKSYYAIFTISQKLKEMGLNDADLRTVNEIINQDSELRDIIQANGLNPKLNVNEKGLICIMTFEDGETPALGHIYEDPAYMEGGENYQPNGDATCTKDGTRTAPCDRCGKVSDTVPDEGSALGHNFREEDVVITPATCTEDGLATGTCTRCNQKNEQVIPALGHDWVEDESKYVAPTCGKEGQRVYNCSRCDETKTEAIEALAHTPDPSKAVVVAPTCTEEGYTRNYCSVCQQNYNTDYTPALGHSWGEWSEEVSYAGADCSQNGYQTRVCERCGATEQKEVPGSATGHIYVYTDVADEDHHLVVCANCGNIRDYKAHVDGNYDFICDECGHEMSFWHHWLHYLVGLPTYGFGNFFTRMMDAFTKFIRMITKDMI